MADRGIEVGLSEGHKVQAGGKKVQKKMGRCKNNIAEANNRKLEWGNGHTGGE